MLLQEMPNSFPVELSYVFLFIGGRISKVLLKFAILVVVNPILCPIQSGIPCVYLDLFLDATGSLSGDDGNIRETYFLL